MDVVLPNIDVAEVEKDSAPSPTTLTLWKRFMCYLEEFYTRHQNFDDDSNQW
jgi:hypothetical protein